MRVAIYGAGSLGTVLGAYTFDGIGNDNHSFNGTFDGNNKTVSNVVINKNGQNKVGFFGFVRNGTVRNLILDRVSITGNNSVGALVGEIVLCSIENSLVMNSSVTNDGSFIGIICGSYKDMGLTGNHYLNCTSTNTKFSNTSTG